MLVSCDPRLKSVAQLVSLIVDNLCQPERRARAGDDFFTRDLDEGIEPEMNLTIRCLVDPLDDDRREKLVDYIQKLSPENTPPRNSYYFKFFVVVSPRCLRLRPNV